MARIELFDYQDDAVAWLTERSGGYLALDPGLGKTAIVVRTADARGADRVLVICPATLKVNWAREFAKFGLRQRPVCTPSARDRIPTSGPLLCVVNYDIIIRPALHRQLLEGRWDLIALDESHALKNPESKRTRAAYGDLGLVKAGACVVPMSGTPAPNHAGELYPALAALHPVALRGMDYHTWLNHYCRVVQGTHGPRVMGHRPAISQLKADLASFVLRRRRAEVLPDLPPLRIGQLVIENERALDALRREVLAVAGDDEEKRALLHALLDEGAAAESTLDDLDELALSSLRQLCGRAKVAALAEEVAGELDGGKEQIVLMCWHHDTMDYLQQALADYGVARVDGKVPPADRQKEVDRFWENNYHTPCRVFVGQIQAAGPGINLQVADDLIIVEASWVPGENVQAMLRIHRIGQKRGCLVRFARLAGSLDEAIMASAERKATLLAELELA